MRKLATLASMLVALAAGSPSHAQSVTNLKPFDFMGHKADAPFSELVEKRFGGKPELHCAQLVEMGSRQCFEQPININRGPFKIADLTVKNLTWAFMDDKLGGVILEFPNSDRDLGTNMLIGKYGKPAATHADGSASWSFSDGQAILTQERDGHWTFLFSSHVAEAAFKERRANEFAKAREKGKSAF